MHGTAARPRASVYRSLQHVYVQLIDDDSRKTLFAATDKVMSDNEIKGKNKSARARLVGRQLGEVARKSGISAVVFDRGGYAYHGRVREVAEGLREAGITV